MFAVPRSIARSLENKLNKDLNAIVNNNSVCKIQLLTAGGIRVDAAPEHRTRCDQRGNCSLRRLTYKHTPFWVDFAIENEVYKQFSGIGGQFEKHF